MRRLLNPLLVLLVSLLFAGCGPKSEESTPAEPDRDAARVRMAQALLRQGHVDDALEQLHKLPPTAENSVGPLAQPEWFEPVVRQLILRRSLGVADSMLRLTGPVADRPPELKALSANLMVLEGDPERAIATWASIRSDDPAMQVRVQHELATLYMLTGRPDEAEDQAREGLGLDPQNWKLHAMLAESLLEQGRPEAALEEVRRMEPGVARWQVEARIQLEGFDRAEEAVRVLGEAARAAPRNPDVRMALAKAHIAAGQYPEARVLLEPLAGLPVPFRGSREALIEVYDAVGEQAAADELRAQLALEADSVRARDLRVAGLQASMAGDLERALDEFDRALQIEPDNANLHNDRGAVLARMQRYDEAEREFLRAGELAPGDPVVLENLARLYQRTGDTTRRDAAIARWQELTGGEAPPRE